MNKDKKTPGRPKKANAVNKMYPLRVYDKQFQVWERQAREDGYNSVAAWLKALADKKAKYNHNP